MAGLRRVFAKFAALILRGRAERELAREVESHLVLLEDDFVSRGMTAEEARLAARRAYGNVEVAKELHRDERSFVWIEQLVQDIRHARRNLRKDVVFTAAAVLTLALGVGANTAIFSVVKAVLLDPLPYAEPKRLVTIAETATDAPDNPTVDYTAVRELREHSQSFESLSAFRDGPGILFQNDKPLMLRGLSVDHTFFETLGVRMQLGRDFLPEEQQPGQRLALIIGHGLWVRQFGADPNILGRVLQLSTFRVTVVGVLPPGFKPLLKATSELDPEMYYPLALDPLWSCHNCSGVHLIGRLRHGVTAQHAREELNGIFQPIVRDDRDAHLRGAQLSVGSLEDRLLGRASTVLWAVWGASGFILLIACANVANLLLARATGRAKEIAVRTALGAKRSRIVRMVLTESLVLALAGGLLGTGVAFFGTKALASLAPERIPRAQTASMDGAALAFALGAALLAGLLCGLAPAWHASRTDLVRAMKGINESGRTHNGLRSGLAATEIALAFVLAVGAGLMAKTFWRLMTVGAGFDPRNVLTLTTSVISPRYKGDAIGYYRDALKALRAIPGIESAAMTSLIPMDYTDRVQFQREDRPVPDERDAPFADQFSVSTDYFTVMRIPLRLGRLFTEQDREATSRVALINESCARALFPGENPVGKDIRFVKAPLMTIVGIVGDVRQDGIDRPVDMQVYTALNQQAVHNYYRLVARTSLDPMSLEHAVRSTFDAVDSGSPVYHVKPLQGYFSGRLANRTFALALLGLFGAIALALAAVGIYGVISYSVAQRLREVGIRIALGAKWSNILRLILQRALWMVVTGLAIGLGASLILTRMLTGLLFEVAPVDPATVVVMSVVLAFVALAAAAVPAHRAARVDPMTALVRE